MFAYVPVNYVQDNPFQRRTEYGNIEELAGQIAANYDKFPASFGIMQIPRIRILKDGELVDPSQISKKSSDYAYPLIKQDKNNPIRMELLYGHRRAAAMRYLRANNPRYKSGLMLVEITQASDDEMLDAVWAENAQRRELSAIEEAELIKDALDKLGVTQKELGERWGVSQPVIANRLRLRGLLPEFQEQLKRGEISERQGLALLNLQRVFFLEQELGNDYMGYGSFGGIKTIFSDMRKEPTVRSSIDLNNMAKQEISSRGKKLNDWQIQFDCEGEVRSKQCTGCKFLVDNHCFARACFETKCKQWARHLASELSNELDIPIEEGYRAKNDYELAEEWHKNRKGIKDLVCLFFSDGYSYVVHPTTPRGEIKASYGGDYRYSGFSVYGLIELRWRFPPEELAREIVQKNELTLGQKLDALKNVYITKTNELTRWNFEKAAGELFQQISQNAPAAIKHLGVLHDQQITFEQFLKQLLERRYVDLKMADKPHWLVDIVSNDWWTAHEKTIWFVTWWLRRVTWFRDRMNTPENIENILPAGGVKYAEGHFWHVDDFRPLVNEVQGELKEHLEMVFQDIDQFIALRDGEK